MLAVVALGISSLEHAAPASAGARADFTAWANAERAARGEPALAWSPELATVATRWAEQMAGGRVLRHNRSLTGQIDGYRLVGENVGVGDQGIRIQRAFMASSRHRSNILDARYREVGVGVVRVRGRLWVTEVFRQPAAAVRLPRRGGRYTYYRHRAIRRHLVHRRTVAAGPAFTSFPAGAQPTPSRA